MGFDRDIAHIACGAALMFAAVICISLYRQRSRNAIVRMLFGAMVLFALMLVKDIVAEAFRYGENYEWVYFSHTLELFWIPAVLAFNFSVISPQWRGRAFLFPPFVLLAAVIVIFPAEAVYYASLAFAALFAAAGFCITLAATVRYNRYVNDNYSDSSNKYVTWVRGVNIIFIFWYIFSAVTMTLYDNWYFDAAKYMIDIGVWSVVYFYSIRHKVIDDLPDMLYLNLARRPQAEVIVSGAVPEPHADSLMYKIYACFDVEKPYLNPDLTVNDLAAAVNSNRTYISKVINNRTGATFLQFVNRYRIRHATELINDSENNRFTLENIAHQSGFTSTTTFYNIFRKEKGCTPREYLRKINLSPND